MPIQDKQTQILIHEQSRLLWINYYLHYNDFFVQVACLQFRASDQFDRNAIIQFQNSNFDHFYSLINRTTKFFRQTRSFGRYWKC